MSPDVYCADASLAAGEPLHGTAASDTDLWIVLEHSEPWGPKGLEDSGVPAPALAHLVQLGRANPRLRIQLIRRPDREAAAPVLFLARSAPEQQAAFRIALGHANDLVDLDLAAFLTSRRPPAGAQELVEPLYLVCVHGKRDRCCAQRGMPVYSAFDACVSKATWQTTHLGGHRFAATLLVLPQGICYGRVSAAEVPALVAAHARGEFHDLSRVRGRTCYAPSVQAAEVLLRELLREHAIAALRFVRCEPIAGGERVFFEHRADGSEHSVEVTREQLPPTPASCGATPKPGERLVALTSR